MQVESCKSLQNTILTQVEDCLEFVQHTVIPYVTSPKSAVSLSHKLNRCKQQDWWKAGEELGLRESMGTQPPIKGRKGR